MHLYVQTNRIEKQLHRLSDVLLPLPAETQPTRLSPAVILLAVARVENICATISVGTVDIIMVNDVTGLKQYYVVEQEIDEAAQKGLGLTPILC